MNVVLIAVWKKIEITLLGVSWQWSWIANNEGNGGASNMNNMKILLFDKRVNGFDLDGVTIV